MVAADNVLPVPGTGDQYTKSINAGILGPPPTDYVFVSGAQTVNMDTSKFGVLRVVAAASSTTTINLQNPLPGRMVTIYAIPGATTALTLVINGTLQWQGDAPNLVIPAGTQIASLTFRYDEILNSGAGTWVEVARHGFDPGWTAPTLGASITNLGSGYATAGYYKDANRYVHLKGVLAGAGLTAGATIFTLPAGYRPSETRLFTGVSNNGSVTGLATITVENNGAVKVNVTNGTGYFTALENARFAQYV